MTSIKKPLDIKVIEEYNQYRTSINKNVLCHAPFVSINFAQNGNLTACCFNRSHVLGQYPFQSVHDAWFGEKAFELRKYISEGNLDGGCKLCKSAIESRNFSASKAIHYDNYADVAVQEKPESLLQKIFGRKAPKTSMPKVFEFELDNTCNLECIMCDGYFSSTIRSQREKLPPVKNPYDDNFVEQIVEFLPSITDLKFLGGEPFLIDIYLKIWEKVIEVNPSVMIHITTNGTVMNPRIKALLNKLKCGIVVSLDSLDKDIYASIRKRGNLEKVLDNIEYFRELTQQKKTYLSLAVCPMRSNWHEMPSMVDFANQRGLSIHFNVVWNPGDVSLRFSHPDLLDNICQVYSSYKPELNTETARQNFSHFTALINQINFWKEERKHAQYLHQKHLLLASKLNSTLKEKQIDTLTENCVTLLLNQLMADNTSNQSKQQLFELYRRTELREFTEAYFKAVVFILSESGINDSAIFKRINKIKSAALQLPDAQTFVNDLIANGPESQFSYFLYENMDQLLETIKSRYSIRTAVQKLT